MTMPNMTGEKLAVELMRIRRDIPIILCTGYGEPLFEERIKNIGIKTLVMKPVLRTELAKAIQNALDKK
jgi:FixJ family two-component response regulator